MARIDPRHPRWHSVPCSHQLSPRVISDDSLQVSYFLFRLPTRHSLYGAAACLALDSGNSCHQTSGIVWSAWFSRCVLIVFILYAADAHHVHPTQILQSEKTEGEAAYRALVALGDIVSSASPFSPLFSARR